MQDFSNADYRKRILEEIFSEENIARKRESFRRSEIYNKRAGPFIDQKLKEEFPDSADSMRKVKSINPAKRMTDAMASIYKNPPTRMPVSVSGAKLSDDQTKFIEDTYELGKWNTSLQRANRVKKYNNQCFLQVLPLDGVISARVYQPHQIDAVPLDANPEKAFGYVTSAYAQSNSLIQGDGKDQKIADKNDMDMKKKKDMRFVWWSAAHNFITDGTGEIIPDSKGSLEIENPIKRLPFIDVHEEKENEFFVSKGSAVCDFAIDLAVILSDTANTNRLQAYGQPVVIAKDNPGAMRFGPDSMIYIKAAEQGEPQPDVKFINANPDLEASMRLITTLMNLFATSEGQSPKLVSSTGDVEKYSSGVDRFLAQLEAFEASKEDTEQFRYIEKEAFDLILAWASIYSGTTDQPLKMKAPSFPAGSYMQVKFSEPQLLQNQKEKEESELFKVEKGISSLVMAVMNIFGMDEESAIGHLKKVREQQAAIAKQNEGNQTEETQTQETSDEETEESELPGRTQEEKEAS